MKKWNRYGFLLIIAVYFSLLLIKAVRLPVTNDEAPAAVAYKNYSSWEIMMFSDGEPNNHILNTLLTKWFIALFGNTQLVIRFPNLLAFLVYGIAIFRINKRILKEDSLFFLPITLLFVSNPYMLSFFALCRGYGISSALATLSASYLVQGYQDNRARPLWIAYGLSMLASYANFTLLVFWCAVSIMVWFHYFAVPAGKWKNAAVPALVLLICTVLYGALIARPMISMHKVNAFQFWSSKGFYHETIYPLIEYSRDGSRLILNPTSHLIAAFIFLVILVNVSYVVVQLAKRNQDRAIVSQPVFVATALLLATVLVNLLQCEILKTPNLHGRTALFLYPLFITVFAAFLSLWPASKFDLVRKSVAIAFAFICIFHMADRFRFKWVRDWWHDSDTIEVLDYLEAEHRDKPVTLKTTWFCYYSFYYYAYTGQVPWLELEGYDKSIDPGTAAQYYYIFREDTAKLVPLFKPVREFGNDRVLMKKQP